MGKRSFIPSFYRLALGPQTGRESDSGKKLTVQFKADKYQMQYQPGPYGMHRAKWPYGRQASLNKILDTNNWAQNTNRGVGTL